MARRRRSSTPAVTTPVRRIGDNIGRGTFRVSRAIDALSISVPAVERRPTPAVILSKRVEAIQPVKRETTSQMLRAQPLQQVARPVQAGKTVSVAASAAPMRRDLSKGISAPRPSAVVKSDSAERRTSAVTSSAPVNGAQVAQASPAISQQNPPAQASGQWSGEKRAEDTAKRENVCKPRPSSGKGSGKSRPFIPWCK